MSFRRTAPNRLSEQMLPFDEAGPANRAVTVSLFLARLNGVLRSSLPDTWVRGEVGEFRVWSSGHAYFTLKDSSACLNAMIFADDVARVPFRVEPGMEVLARGRPNVYAPSGKMTFVVSEIQPYGAGAQLLALEQLKARLTAEGLFLTSRKRPLPALPARIGVVTSRKGAVVRDILKVLSHRFPNAHVTIYPVAVQGPGSAEEIARAITAFSRARGADVLIVARGGGSREDLAAFNTERVVRAVANSEIPTVSAVGHETDVSLTDLAADVRAATPSQAAELVVARREELENALAARQKQLAGALRQRLNETRARLSSLSGADGLGAYQGRVARASVDARGLSRSLVASVRNLPSAFGERLVAAEERLLSWPQRAALPLRGERVDSEARALSYKMNQRLTSARERLGSSAGALSALDPLRVLARGYSVTYRGDGRKPVTDVSQVAPGESVRIVVARGEITATVDSVELPKPLPEDRT